MENKELIVECDCGHRLKYEVGTRNFLYVEPCERCIQYKAIERNIDALAEQARKASCETDDNFESLSPKYVPFRIVYNKDARMFSIVVDLGENKFARVLNLEPWRATQANIVEILYLLNVAAQQRTLRIEGEKLIVEEMPSLTL